MSSTHRVALVVRNTSASAGDMRLRVGSCLGGEDPWRREWRPVQVFLLRESHGQESGGL